MKNEMVNGLHIGQKIRIKEDIDTRVGLYFAPKMRQYLGKIVVITGFDGDGQYIHAAGWSWHPKWIERGVKLQ